MPDCMNGTGCLIGEAIARDPEINQIVNNYYLAHCLPSAERSPSIAQNLFVEVGLSDDIDLLMEMDATMCEHRNKKREQAQIERKHKTLLES